jgi:predicted amidophosphoribosyltransferase
VRTCTLCQSQSPDDATHCAQCGADLSQHSATAVALAKLLKNPRVSRVRLIVASDACPACRAMEGDYKKDQVPELPVRGCSHPSGCRCFYEPFLTDIYP